MLRYVFKYYFKSPRSHIHVRKYLFVSEKADKPRLEALFRKTLHFLRAKEIKQFYQIGSKTWVHKLELCWDTLQAHDDNPPSVLYWNPG